MYLVIGTIAVTLVSGIFGGYGGYLVGQTSSLDKPVAIEIGESRRKLYWRMSLVLGVIAAFTVPTFLQIMSLGNENKTLLDGVLLGEPDKWFIYAGFCLIAGFSGQRFVKRLSSKLLDEALSEAKEARIENQDIKEEVKEIRDDLDVASLIKRTEPLDNNSLKVLHAVELSGKRRVNIKDIIMKVDLDKEDINKAILNLEENFMLSPKELQGEVTWRTRSAGRAALKNIKIDTSD